MKDFFLVPAGMSCRACTISICAAFYAAVSAVVPRSPIIRAKLSHTVLPNHMSAYRLTIQTFSVSINSSCASILLLTCPKGLILKESISTATVIQMPLIQFCIYKH